MAGRESQLDMARRHVTCGRLLVQRQGALILNMRSTGGDTLFAESLYETFAALLDEMYVRLDRLEAPPVHTTRGLF